MKKYIYRIWNFFSPPATPTYGWKIFEQRSWLEKQVQEKLLKQREY
jgi:hypothetical protein